MGNIFAHVQPDDLPLPKMSVDDLLASWAVNRAQERGCGYCFAG